MLSFRDSKDINLAAHITLVKGSTVIVMMDIFSELNKEKCLYAYKSLLRTE